MKIIILSLSHYKEHDAIVNAISEEEYLTFKINGLYTANSKNAAINNVLTVADVVLTKSAKSQNINLKESSLIYSPLNSNLDLSYLAVVNCLAEATNKMLDDEEKPQVFNLLLSALAALKEKQNPFAILIMYLSKLLKITGYSFEINRCVRCGGKADIVTFSFVEGGFICKKCIEEEDPRDLTASQMLLIRNLAGSTEFDFSKLTLDEADLRIIIDRYIRYIADGCGIYLESPKILINN